MRSIGFSAILFFVASFSAAAADLNGYTAEYECRSGGSYCNVDVDTLTAASCDVTVTTSDSDWTKITGDSGQTVYCIDKGDHTSKGTLTLNHSGTSGTRKVLRYYRSGDTDDDPWDQSTANRANLKKLDFNSNDYWIVHRLTWDGDDVVGTSSAIVFDGNSDNNILSRILIEEVLGTGVVAAIYHKSGGDNNVIQNSVCRNTTIATNSETPCIEIKFSNNIYLVNNEFYNVPNTIFLRQGGGNVVVENNDVYNTSARYTDCSGNYTTSGGCGAVKGLLSTKGGGLSASPAKFIHNRIWGGRRTDRNVCCTSTGRGMGVSLSNDRVGEPSAEYILIQNNIIFESHDGIVTTRPGPQNNSIIGNIIYDIQDFDGILGESHAFNALPENNTEFYLNTIIKTESASYKGWSWTGQGNQESDYRCNVIIDSGKRTGTPGSGTSYNHNSYYGTTDSNEEISYNSSLMMRTIDTTYSVGNIIRISEASACMSNDDPNCFLYRIIVSGTPASTLPNYSMCTELGCELEDGTMKVQAIRGPYTFYRKLKTSPETYTIPYARIYKSATEVDMCPTDFADRSGIGINDVIYEVNPIINTETVN